MLINFAQVNNFNIFASPEKTSERFGKMKKKMRTEMFLLTISLFIFFLATSR